MGPDTIALVCRNCMCL